MGPAAPIEGDELEREAATILGYMLFEYSRLDVELGLFIAWSDEGRKLGELSGKPAEANFNSRLDFLEKLTKSKYSDTPAANEYAKWLLDAHGVRALRNRLFHGRWGFLPQQRSWVTDLARANRNSLLYGAASGVLADDANAAQSTE